MGQLQQQEIVKKADYDTNASVLTPSEAPPLSRQERPFARQRPP